MISIIQFVKNFNLFYLKTTLRNSEQQVHFSSAQGTTNRSLICSIDRSIDSLPALLETIQKI